MKTLLIFFLMLSPFLVQAGTIEVGSRSSNLTLKQAIKQAKSGDSIMLRAGRYREGNIVIDKSLSLIGTGNPILDGENKYQILTISGSNVRIEGILFVNAGFSSTNDLAAISIINASGIIIENNQIEKACFAIHVANANYCIVRNNKIQGAAASEQSSGNGIHLWKCNNMLIENNEVQGHRDGIYFEFVSHSLIQQNYSTGNIRYGLHFMFSPDNIYTGNTFKENGAGVAVMFSKNVLMYKNDFDQNWGAASYGILLKEISDSRIIENRFYKNTIGIMMEGTNRIEVRQNRFLQNGWCMKVQASCSDNQISFNNFLGNTFDISTNGSMQLSFFHHNYWDKYEGYDLDKNGLGDVPYHPVSLYSMIIEENPNSLLLLRSFMVSLLDKAERAIPSMTPENLRDESPQMKPLPL